MRSNADVTIYMRSVDPTTRTEDYTRVHVRCIYWEATVGVRMLPNGTIKDDKATIYIPFTRAPLDLQEGHIIAKGLIYEEIEPGFTVSDLKRKYPDVLTIRNVAPRDAGSPALRHWEISAS